MKPVPGNILTINGGSSSIKFGLFEATPALQPVLSGRIELIGQPDGAFVSTGTDVNDRFRHPLAVPDQRSATLALMDWLRKRIKRGQLVAIGHRIVHGGPRYWKPESVNAAMLKELRELCPFDPEHLPEEIMLAEAFHKEFPKVPQIACFDTAFHHDMPRVAQIVPVPRRYEAMGVRRYGFHGLSCAYLMEELCRVASPNDAQGRVVLAHLGNGASATAVKAGKSVDTSMGFTPTSGIPMGTRSGDLDPGLAWYLARTEELTARQFSQMINHESGLVGVSETSSDMAILLASEADDIRAAEAVELFCYQAKKWICALAGAMGGLDTLVFSGGIGENSPRIRERICAGLEFIGIELDKTKNDENAALISTGTKTVSVRVVATDEGWMIARTVLRDPSMELLKGKFL